MNDDVAAMINLQNSYPELELWGKVLRAAITDLGTQTEKQITLTWFKSPRIDEGSFVWICLALDLEPGKVRESVLRRSGMDLAA